VKKVIFWILVYCFAVSRLGLAATEEVIPKAMLLPFPNQAAIPAEGELALPSPQESPAYKQYLKRPKTELSKILYLLERLKMQNLKILYNGKVFEPCQILTIVKAHIALTYKKEKAQDWIQVNAYKSRSKGQVIYLEYPNGQRRILRDVLLEELASLPIL
jgi:hypothetical protein